MNNRENLSDLFSALVGCDLTVEELDLEVAAKNSLQRGGVHTLAQLLKLTHAELAAIFPNRKLRCYEDVIHRLICLSEEPIGMDSSGFEPVGNSKNM